MLLTVSTSPLGNDYNNSTISETNGHYLDQAFNATPSMSKPNRAASCAER